MDLELLKLILQSLSSFAIAGGLIFSAVQFWYWRKGARTANFAKLVELQMQLRRMRVDDPSLAAVYKDDVRNLATDQEIREYFFNLMQLSVFEIVWFMNREGQLSHDYFDSWVKRMRVIEQEESFRKMFENPSMKILHDDFQKYIADSLKNLPRNA